jgi:cell division inhibitor SepF
MAPAMALRDTWHRTLVYFGLAEDDRYYEPELEDVEETAPEPEHELKARYRERPNVRRLNRRRGVEEIDDIFSDEPAEQHERPERRPTRVLHAVPDNGHGGRAGVQVHLVVPKNFNDAQQVADQFKNELPVILNLQGTDTELAKRLIDFSSGLTYALDGGMQKVADKVFMLTPPNVEVSAEERARLIEKGFYNQS